MQETESNRGVKLLRAHLYSMQATIQDSIAKLSDLTTDATVDGATKPLIEKLSGQASNVKAALDAYADLLQAAPGGGADGEGGAYKK